MDVLVTGGAGFIGSHIVDDLTAGGHRVRVLDVLYPAAHHSGEVPGYASGYDLVQADVRDAGAVAAALTGVDAVCHQAAMVGLGVDIDDITEYAGINDLGTAVLLQQMARADVGTLVLASSMVIYGEGRYRCPAHGVQPAPPRAEADLADGRFEPPCPVCGAALELATVTEDVAADPRNVYAATKLAQEHLAASWARSTGGTVAALRYHNVYGPRMPRDTPYAGVASIFRSALERGEAPKVFEDGGQTRDFVHVRDVAAANVAALAGPREPGTLRAYNVASGVPHTVGDMARALATAFGGPPPEVTGGYRLGDVRHIVASADRARAELEFTATIDFDEGMAEFARAKLRD